MMLPYVGSGYYQPRQLRPVARSLSTDDATSPKYSLSDLNEHLYTSDGRYHLDDSIIFSNQTELLSVLY